MSLLSDISIEKLCVAPTHVTEVPADPNKMTKLPGGGFASTLLHTDRTPVTRETTEEERAAFRPMIAPFNREKVRYACALDAFDNSEQPYWKQQYPEGVRNHQYVPERKIISRGLSSYGYDVTLADTNLKLFTNINSSENDPKNFNGQLCLTDATIRTAEDGSRYVLIPPRSYLLGHTIEQFVMPRDVTAVCLGKSTYARVGVIVNVTPIEAGWEGQVVLEIFNSTELPTRVYVNEGICQFLFFQGDQACRESYAERGGKYQGQTGLTLAKA